MTPFSHLSFLRKLTLFVLAATVFALSMTFVALTLYERSSFREARRNELSLLGSNLGQNSAASLVFNDQKTATDILAALQADPHIIAACLFDNTGRVFAEYPHPRPQGLCSLATASSGTAHFTSNSLSWYQDVFLQGDKCGSIVIVSDLKAFNRKIAEYIQIEGLILLVAFLLTYFLSLRLLRIATDPILQLAQLAGRVSSEKDYSLRAPRAGADEVGILTLSFNDMLDGIQQRDVALQAGRDELEIRVHERTEALRREVSVRIHAEEALSKERQVLRALIDNVPNLMYVKDTLSRFVVANTAVARAMGLHSSGELIGKTDSDFFPREFAASYYQNEQDVISSKQPVVDHEEQTVTQTGHRIWLLTTRFLCSTATATLPVSSASATISPLEKRPNSSGSEPKRPLKPPAARKANFSPI